MAGTIKTSKLNCTENSGSTFTLTGVPLATATLFTKTFTVVSGHVFNKAPSINLNSVSDKNSYTVVVNDTGSIAGKNLTVRSFVVKYKYPLKPVSSDVITFIARADLDIANSVGKIYKYNFNEKWVRAAGETRLLTIYGDEADANNAAASLTLDFKRGNTSIRVAPDGTTGSGTVNIPVGGVYEENIIFPRRDSNASYSVVLTQRASNSFLTLPTPETISLNQYINPTITAQIIESGSDFLVAGLPITLKAEPYSTPGKGKSIDWTITAQSATVPLKYVGVFNRSDFSGSNYRNGTKRLSGGSILDINSLSVEIYPKQTGVTTGNTATTTVTLNAVNNSIVKGMRVSGSGISKTGAISPLITSVSGAVITLSVTPGSTISSGTTLTFHSAAHVYGEVEFVKIGTANATCDLNAANIIGINQPPVPSFTGTTTISSEEASNFTTMTLAASDPEGDAITFVVTVMPQHGIFKYTDVQNNVITVTCSGQTLSSNNTIHASTRTVQYKPADGNSNNTSFQYTTADPYNTAVSTTITLNILA